MNSYYLFILNVLHTVNVWYLRKLPYYSSTNNGSFCFLSTDKLYSKLSIKQPCKVICQSNKTGSEKLNVLISKRDAQGNLRRLRKRMWCSFQARRKQASILPRMLRKTKTTTSILSS